MIFGGYNLITLSVFSYQCAIGIYEPLLAFPEQKFSSGSKATYNPRLTIPGNRLLFCFFREPTELNVLWFRGHRTKSSAKPTWSTNIPNNMTKITTCTSKWIPPNSVDLIVTLYKDSTGKSFKKKDYMFVMEDICGTKRKKLALFPCNLATYVSVDGEIHDLEFEFKSLSKKVKSAKCGLKIRCEFIKEGSAIDDDIQSNFSHMSEAEEFSRMSELAEVSDEDDNKSYDDLPKEDTNEMVIRDETEPRPNEEMPGQNEDTFASDVNLTKTKMSKPWSKFVADMNTFEWLRSPLSSNSKKKRMAEQLKEKAEMKENIPETTNTESFDLPNSQDKQLIKAKSMDCLDASDEHGGNDDAYKNNTFKGSTLSLFSEKSQNGFRTSIKETFKNVTSKTSKDMEAKLQEKTNQIWNLEQESKRLSCDNRELLAENNKLQDDIIKLQNQRDEMQTEIGELQILVEDLKVRLSQSEAEHKQLRKDGQELLAMMNLRGWLCKRGVKGPTGRQWRRRWFATDESGKLYYYKQNNNSTPQGFIDLDKIIEVGNQLDERQDKNQASFYVVVGKRKYEFLARDSEEKQKWINALDYLRHWRSHTSNISKNDVRLDESDALNPFLNPEIN
ncbi:uncharacterized protein LOC124457063 isoform X2 [Xenia sp. Carnegie-2017]|uniref:uncharacterized protein LOC124457063 isoform X2 n=1 Tax=Xenia sp. Carnegie-2017 TaxID=2897299 RepID=UPI001F045598|nr:uncharacterized protein LOC124457063 isoform X2 [Xenia sp. Carnegie-2017]